MKRNFIRGRNQKLSKTEYDFTMFGFLFLGLIINIIMYLVYRANPVSDGFTILISIAAISYLYLLKKSNMPIGLPGCIFIFLVSGIVLSPLIAQIVNCTGLLPETLSNVLLVTTGFTVFGIIGITIMQHITYLIIYGVVNLICLFNIIALWPIPIYLSIIWWVKANKTMNEEWFTLNEVYQLGINIYKVLYIVYLVFFLVRVLMVI